MSNFIGNKLGKALFALLIAASLFSISNRAEAGYWVNTHECGANNVTAGEGAGLWVALRDKQCFLPASGPIDYTIQDGNGAQVSSLHNGPSCVAAPAFNFSCSGASSHYCYTGNEYGKFSENRATPGGECIAVRQQSDGGCSSKATDNTNPIQIIFGRKVQDFEDWSSGGTHPLKFVRSYASSYQVLLAPSYSRLGKAWRSNFDAGATFLNAGANPLIPALYQQVHIVLPDAIEYSFRFDGTNWKNVQPIGHPAYSNIVSWDQVRTDTDFSVTTTPDSLDFRTENNTHYLFNASGKLTKIIFPDGYSQSLFYSGSLNTKVVDSLGHFLQFKYDTNPSRVGYLSTVTTGDGKQFTYRYKNLETVPELLTAVGAELWALDSVLYPDATPAVSTDNPTGIYTYLGSLDRAHPYSLTGLIDERGIQFAAWTYDARGRAVSSEHIGGLDRHTLTFDDVNNKVTVTNPFGKQTVYSYAEIVGRGRTITAVDGIASTGCAASNTAYTFDANGFRSQATDAEGRITQWARNARGLATSTIEAAGTAGARTTSTAWDATRPLPTQITAPNLTTNITYNADGNVTQLSQVDTTTTTLPYVTTGQTRTTAFNYSVFTPPAPPAIAATGAVLSDVPLTIVNSNAETGNVSGWTPASPLNPLTFQTPGLLDPNGESHPCTVTKCFGGGAWLAGAQTNSVLASQDIAIPAVNFVEIDSGQRASKVIWKQVNRYSRDAATVRQLYLNATGVIIGSATPTPILTEGWTTRENSAFVPVGTRTIRLQMLIPSIFASYVGNWYIDDITLSLTAGGTGVAQPLLAIANAEALATPATGWAVTPVSITTTADYPCNLLTCFKSNPTGQGQLIQDITIPFAVQKSNGWTCHFHRPRMSILACSLIS
jgi:YD repeat-containing protein